MSSHIWRVEWTARPQPEGSDRLSVAVRLVIDRAISSPGPSATEAVCASARQDNVGSDGKGGAS
jgi:hypothetical protein